ncbi:ABC transporter substrate-binding protein [Maridesulfovibrio hydrothermalis]|uniref:Toluene tolerance family protein n=1 Tax=Maridesulfovibrio hydrothermalis AM13 = DSM 14728 TaxID=1121451 RepID=L0R976_9BACT|nr:ABC transporter substrate-binding protein [Maridesulfovibrio hydrothermalis]CCO22772.1 Toluene tolerance family protein [Maridesulfovibrio hydrothermalis AM13 = DSM 14728]
MKRIAAASLFIILLTLTAGAGFSFAENSPMVRLRGGIQGVIDIINDPQYKGHPEKQEEMTLKIRETIKDFFNFEELSKRAIGRPWLQFTPEEKKQFVELFTTILEKSYLGRIEEYSGEKVAFDKETIIKGKYAQVDTRLLTGKEDIPVFYRMKLVDGVWDVYDVKIEGISLVRNYKTQFSGILDTTSEKSLSASKKELFARLKQKCQELNNNNHANADSGKSSK